MHNYIVKICDWHGHRTIHCETEDEVWVAIGSRAFGGLYEVYSETGKELAMFTVF